MQRPDSGVFAGWKVLAAAVVSQALASGMFAYGFGVLQVPIAEAYGVPRATVTWGLSGAMALGAVLAPLLGRGFDRRSIRGIMLASGLAAMAGYFAMAAAGPLPAVVVLYAVASAVGIQGMGNLAASKLVANWFVLRRGRALGIAAMGTSIGGLVAPPLLAEGIARWGWRPTVAVGGAVLGVVSVIAILGWIRDSPRALGLWPDGAAHAPAAPPGPVRAVATSDLLRDRAFWSLTLIVAVLFATTGSLIANLPPMAQELGLEATPAAGLVSILSVAAIAGKLAFGIAAERVDKRLLLAITIALLGAFVVLMQTRPAPPLLALGALLPGIALGGVLPLWGALLADYWGSEGLGTAMGTMAPFATGIQVVTIQLVPWCFDHYGTYAPVFGGYLALLALAFVAIALLPRGPAAREAAPTEARSTVRG